MDYPAKTILNTGRAEGRLAGLTEGRRAGLAEGRLEGALDTCVQLVKKGMLTVAQAAAQLEMTEEELKSKMS